MQTLPHQSHIFLTFCPIWSPQKEMRNTVHCTISPWQINRSQAVIHHMFQTAVHLSITASLCKLSLCLGVPTVGPSPWNPQWCILDTLSKAAAQTRAPSKGAPLLQQNWGRGDAEKRVTAGLTKLIWEKSKWHTWDGHLAGCQTARGFRVQGAEPVTVKVEFLLLVSLFQRANEESKKQC